MPRVFSSYRAFFLGFLFLLSVTGTRAANPILEWDANTEADLAGYRVYYGTTSRTYGTVVDVGNVTRVTISNLAPGTTYFFAATAYNTAGLESAPSAEISFTPPTSNQPPVISVAAPAANTQFVAPATVTITANASDPDGTITRVEFFNGASKLGEVVGTPFDFTWSNVPAGTYQITAIAWDNFGASSTSAVAQINVTAPNQPPTVVLITPASNTTYSAPATINIAAFASDPDGTVALVEFFSKSLKIGQATSAPFEVVWNTASPGSYAITAVASDDRGASTISGPSTIIVNAPPVISLATNGTSFVAPATIIMDATASDSDGTISRVDFYNGPSKIGERTEAPFSWTLSSVAAGTYSLRALGQDNRGAEAWSNGIQVTVAAANQTPTVSFTAPLSGTIFTAPANITIAATAIDADGSVARVEFFANETSIGASTAAPFVIEWRDVGSGIYNLSAAAFDNHGASKTSAVVKITVNAPPVVTVYATSSTIFAGDTLSLQAIATDLDGWVRRVEFFSGGILLGKDRNDPYRFNWNNVPPGMREISAVAYDNLGSRTQSAALTVTVLSSGEAKVIAGESMVTTDVLPKVQSLGTSYDGAFELRVEGQPGDIYDVWYSEDLRTWSLLMSVLNPDGIVTVSDYTVNLSGTRFYRVSVQ